MGKIKGERAFRPEHTDFNHASDSVDKSFFKRNLLDIANSLGRILKPKSEFTLSNIRKTLTRAGYRKNNAVIIFYGIKTMCAIVMPIFIFLLKLLVVKAISPANLITYSVAAALLGFYIPNFWLSLVIRDRKRQIIEGFPDALDLMIICVESGMGLDAAVFRAGREMELRNKVLSEEFKLLNLELRAGKLRHEALRSFADRIDEESVRSLVSLLIQADRFGTSIAQSLRVHSEVMRVRRFQRAEEIASKLPVKLVFPLILFIFPSLFVVLLGPAMITMYRSLFPYLGRG
jgi:tight adherence protein C